MKTFVEFFAGVGLVREGLSKTKWKCLLANDISVDKQETYIANFGNGDFLLCDIWDLAKNKNLIPDNPFLYTASFPCTDLSVAGSKAGLAGKHSSTLNAVLEILKNKKVLKTAPKVVLLENVKGFLTSHKGKDIAQTVEQFSRLGYFVDIIELDAIDFSAQSRPRVFLIAVEANLARKTMKIKNESPVFEKWWSDFNRHHHLRSEKIKKIILGNENLNWALFDVKSQPKSSVRLKDIIETEIPEKSSLWWDNKRQNHLFNQMSDNHKRSLEEIIESPELSYGTVYRRMRKGKSMAELRIDGYAGCLRTPIGGSSKQILIRAGKGNWKVRLLTPREYARLQGVRDCFKLPNNSNKGYFAMGDAVCVPVIEFIAENILDYLYTQSIMSNGRPYSNRSSATLWLQTGTQDR